MPARRIYNTTTEKEVRAYLAQGMTIDEVASVLDVSPRMLHHACSVFGLKSTGRGLKRPQPVAAHNPFRITA